MTYHMTSILNYLVLAPIFAASIAYATTQIPKKLHRISVALIVLVFFGYHQLQLLPSTHYDFFELSPLASKGDIHSAYRRLAKQLHPDKTSDNLENHTLFQSMKKKYDILYGDESRRRYNRFGDLGEYTIKASNVESLIATVIGLTAAFHGICFSLAMLLTLAPRWRVARQVCLIYHLIVFVLEMYLRMVDDDASFNFIFLSELTAFQRIWIVRRAFPGLLLIGMTLSDFLFISAERGTIELLKGVHTANQVLIERSHLLLLAVAALNNGNPVPKPPQKESLTSSTSTKPETQQTAPTLWKRLDEKLSDAEKSELIQDLVNKKKGSTSSEWLPWIVGGIAVVAWLLAK